MGRHREKGERRSGHKKRSRREREEEQVAFMAEGDEEQAPAEAPAEDPPADETGAAAEEDAPAEEEAPADDTGAAAEEDGGDAPAEGEEAPAEDAGGEEAPAEDAPADDAPAEIEVPPEPTAEEIMADLENGADFDAGEIEDDEKAAAYAERMADKAGVKSRVKIYKLCNMCEDAAQQMADYALDNPMEKENALSRRKDLLQALYYLRFVSDVDDDFLKPEYEAEMKNIKVYRSKMARLSAKEDEFRPSDDDESSDDEVDEADDMDVLKEARKLMEHSFGKEAKPFNKGLV